MTITIQGERQTLQMKENFLAGFKAYTDEVGSKADHNDDDHVVVDGDHDDDSIGVKEVGKLGIKLESRETR